VAWINPHTRYFEGDWHGEPHPSQPWDRWCAGCRAWTVECWWHRHAWHAPTTQPARM